MHGSFGSGIVDEAEFRGSNLDRLRIEAAAAAEEIEQSVAWSHRAYPVREFDSLGFPDLAGKRIRPLVDGAGHLGAFPAFRFPLIPKPGFLAFIGVRLA